MSQNIFVATVKMINPLIQIPSNGITLMDLLVDKFGETWVKNNRYELNRINSIKFYVHLGKIGILYDGNIATYDNSFIIEEGQTLIENIEIKNFSIVGPGTISLQIGKIG